MYVTIQSHGHSAGARTHYVTANGVRNGLNCCVVTAWLHMGPLMGGLQCRMSILRNGNVAFLVAYFPRSQMEVAMSHVTIIFSPCHMSLSPMSRVEFKKCPCNPVDFGGQAPYT